MNFLGPTNDRLREPARALISQYYAFLFFFFLFSCQAKIVVNTRGSSCAEESESDACETTATASETKTETTSANGDPTSPQNSSSPSPIPSNSVPTIALSSQSTPSAVQAGQPLTINWTASDPDDDATISFYLTDTPSVTADECANGPVVKTDLSEDAAGTSDSFNVYAKEGDYYLCAVIDDGTNNPSVNTAPGMISISTACTGAALSNSLSANGSGTSDDPHLICTTSQLSEVNSVGLTKHYVIGNDIDAVSTYSLNAGAGFEPIAPDTTAAVADVFDGTKFSGSFDGLGYTVSNLYMNRPTEDFVGLFGAIDSSGMVKNLYLKNYQVVCRGRCAAVAGISSGHVQKIAASGYLGSNTSFGGIVAENSGSIKDVYTETKNYSGTAGGGIVWQNSGTVENVVVVAYGALNGYLSAGIASDNSGSISRGIITGWANNVSVTTNQATGTVQDIYYESTASIGACVDIDNGTSSCTPMENQRSLQKSDFVAYNSNWNFGKNGTWLISNSFATPVLKWLNSSMGVTFAKEISFGRKIGYSDAAAYKIWGYCDRPGSTITLNLSEGTVTTSPITCSKGVWSAAADFSAAADSGADSYLSISVQYSSGGTIATQYLKKDTSYCSTRTGNSPFAGGDGLLVSTPYTICTAAQLNEIRNTIDGNSYFFEIKDNIDLDPALAGHSANWFVPIGSQTPANNCTTSFCGKMEGNGFAIKNLTISSTLSYKGLFTGLFTPATISNIRLENFELRGNGTTGALSGLSYDDITVSNLQASSFVAGTSTYKGGLIGYMGDNATVVGPIVNHVNIDALVYNRLTVNPETGGLFGFAHANRGTFKNINIEGVVFGYRTVGTFSGNQSMGILPTASNLNLKSSIFGVDYVAPLFGYGVSSIQLSKVAARGTVTASDMSTGMFGYINSGGPNVSDSYTDLTLSSSNRVASFHGFSNFNSPAPTYNRMFANNTILRTPTGLDSAAILGAFRSTNVALSNILWNYEKMIQYAPTVDGGKNWVGPASNVDLAGVTSVMNTAMQSQATFTGAGYNFTTGPWIMSLVSGYPRLWFEEQQRIFVTSLSYDGNLGGFNGADELCETRAASADLAGRWKALLRINSLDFDDRILGTKAIYNTNNQKIADSLTELFAAATIPAQLVYDETGASRSTTVWTGSDASSDNTHSCNQWTSNNGGDGGMYGTSNTSDTNWSDTGTAACNLTKALYCVSIPFGWVFNR